MDNPISANLFFVYTGNRFNQVLIFPTWDKAAAWLRNATLFSELEITRAIKTPSWDGYRDFISVTDH